MKTVGVYGMAGFSKVFSTIWGGSLHGHFEASAVFLVFLSLADREGTVDMTPQAIAGTTGWPLDFILKGIEELESPDPKSRTEGHEGRRILPLDSHRSWGWVITNYSLYRDKMRSADRTAYLAEKQREYRARKSTTVNTSTNINQDKPIAEAEAESDTEAKNKTAPSGAFEQFWNEYPRKVGKQEAFKVWNKKRLDPIAPTLILDVRTRKTSDDSWKDKKFIPHASTYLNQERWTDEVQKYEAPKRNLSAVERVAAATRAREAERNSGGGTLAAHDRDLRPQVGKLIR